MIRPDVDALRRVEFVTANYAALQGLRFLPLGVLLVVFGVGELGIALGDWWLWLLYASIAGAVVGVPLAGRYYRSRFGLVTPRRHQQGWLGLLVGGALGYALAWAGQWELPVSVPGLGFAAVAGLWAWRWQPFMRGQLVAALVLAVLSLAPLGAFTGAASHPFTPRVVGLCIGAWLVVGGLVNHRKLVQALGDA